MIYPQREDAYEMGCTCKWFGSGSIIVFDPDCPILEQHHVPEQREHGEEEGQ